MHKRQPAPDFALPDQHGNLVRLADLTAHGPAVVFFYPVALSGGCTEELNHFKELAPQFAAAGATLAGISRDSVERQAEFARTVGVDFALLSDPEEKVIEDYGVKRRLLAKVLPVKRSSLVISPSGEILAITNNETDMRVHAEHSLEVVQSLRK